MDDHEDLVYHAIIVDIGRSRRTSITKTKKMAIDVLVLMDEDNMLNIDQ